MKKSPQVGLIVEGNSTQSIVLRLSNLVQKVGPIKATSIRVASRVSNYLKAGYPVEYYEGLQTAKLIFIRAPDASIPRIVQELCAADLPFRDLTFVLCETWMGSERLAALTDKHSHVATLMPLNSDRLDWFIVEGSVPATRQVKRVVEENETRALELRTGAKPLYFAASVMTGAIPIPVLVAAQQILRSAGITGNQLDSVLDGMVQMMLGSVLRGARSSWSGVIDEAGEQTSNQYLQSLRLTHPEFFHLVQKQMQLAEETRMVLQENMQRVQQS